MEEFEIEELKKKINTYDKEDLQRHLNCDTGAGFTLDGRGAYVGLEGIQGSLRQHRAVRLLADGECACFSNQADYIRCKENEAKNCNVYNLVKECLTKLYPSVKKYF